MGIFRYNQEGVASDVTFGRQGGHIKWNNTNFELLDKAGNANVDLMVRGSSVATQDYVNSKIQGLRTKVSANLAINTQHTFTQAVTTIDGVAVKRSTGSNKDGSRVLVMNQTDAKTNGLYYVDSAGVLQRAEDANTYQLIEGAYIFVSDGAAFEGTGWVLNVVDDTIVSTTAAGTYDIEVKQFHGKGSIRATTGLKANGNEVSLSLWELGVFSGTVNPSVSTQEFVLVDSNAGTTSQTRVPVNKVLTDLGLNPHQIQHGDNVVSVSTDRNTARDDILFGVKASTDGKYSKSTSIVSASAAAFKVHYTQQALLANTVGSEISLQAGQGRGAKGGNITLKAGAGDGVDQLGGDIVLTTGTSGTGSAARPGIVHLDTNTAVRIPSGTASQRPIGAQGMIRMVTDAVTGTDAVEYYDAQKSQWKIISSAHKVSDLDGDTYVSVAGSASGDEDIIKLVVGPTGGTYDATTALELTGDGVVLQVPNVATASRATVDGGHLTLKSGTGRTGGNIDITAGDGASTSASGGNVNVTAGVNAKVTFQTKNASTSNSGNIEIVTGNSAAAKAGDIIINAGTSVASQKSAVKIGNVNTNEVLIGNRVATGALVTIDSKTVKVGVNADAIEVGHVASASETKLYGSNITMSAATAGATGGTAKIIGKVVSIGDDATTTDIKIGNQTADTTNVAVKGNDVLVQADNSLEFKASTVNKHVKLSTTGTGVVTVSNPSYTASISSGDTLVNQEYVANSIRDAKLGGVGRRVMSINMATESVLNKAFDALLPSNAHVTRVTVDVEEAVVGGVNSMTIVAASGHTSLVTNNDIDITATGLYIIELAGRTASGGAVTSVFNTNTSGATAGKIHVTLEFVAK